MIQVHGVHGFPYEVEYKGESIKGKDQSGPPTPFRQPRHHCVPMASLKGQGSLEADNHPEIRGVVPNAGAHPKGKDGERVALVADSRL